MRIRNLGPKLSGAPAPGEVGEVDDDLGELMLAKGYAERVDRLENRLKVSSSSADFRQWPAAAQIDAFANGAVTDAAEGS